MLQHYDSDSYPSIWYAHCCQRSTAPAIVCCRGIFCQCHLIPSKPLQSNPPIPARPDRLKAAIPATDNSSNKAHVGEANSSTETGPALQDDANAYPLQPNSNMTDTSETQTAVQPEVLEGASESPADTGYHGSSGWQGESDTDLGPKGKELAAESPIPPETMLGDIVGGVCACGKIDFPEKQKITPMRMRMLHNPVVRNNPPRQVPIGDIRTSDAYPAGDGDRAEGDAWAAQSIADSLNTYGKAPPADETDASAPTQGTQTPPPPPFFPSFFAGRCAVV
jgi:hypothetical protein